MRILLRDLSPATVYALQLRSVSGDQVSDWSRVFTITTQSDVIAPKMPVNTVGSMVGTSFKLSWDAVTLSTDDTPASDLDRYEVLVSSTGTATTGNYITKDTKFEFSLEQNRMLFGAPRANIQMAVRSVDKAGNTAGYTTAISQTNAAPAVPANFSGAAGQYLLNFKWDGVADTDLKEYRVYMGTTAGTQSTLYWSGTATAATIQITDTTTDRYYKVVAVDVFGTESASSTVVGPLKPTSPVGVDTTAPSTPTGLAATLTNATDGKTAQAAVSWTAVTDTDNDLASYILGYKPSADSDWNYAVIDYTLTSTLLKGLIPYVNYDFRIRASDFSANLSAWSSTLTKTATANAAPATPTGLAMTAGRDNLQISWNENTEPDMINNAGVYDVTVATNSGFTTGVLQYRTGGTTLSVNGLATSTAYWARVRAVDSGGNASSYSTSVTQSTSSFPGTALSDGSVPTGAVTVTATAGIGYVYLNWTALTNADPVIYDVYMSTTNGFTTYDATTKITEVSGTSAIIDTTVAGASLTYGTTYYFKVRARDRDGSSTSISAQASAAPSKAGTADISTIDASLITSNTSFTTNLFIGSGGAIQSTGYTGGGTTGFQLSNNGLTIKGTNNVVDAGVLKGGTITGTTINVGTGGVLNVDSTASIKSNNYSAGTTGYSLGSTGLEVNDGAIDAKVLRTNSAVIGDLVIGRSADALGTIRSFDYSAGVAGWKIGKGLAEFNSGTIRAAALQIQDSQNLMPLAFSDFEFAPTYYGSGMLSIANVTQTVVTSGAKYHTAYMQLRATTAAAFDAYLGSSAVDYNVDVEANSVYIVSAWVKTGAVASSVTLKVKYSGGTTATVVTQALGASGAWQRIQGSVTTPVGTTGLVVLVSSTTATTGAGFDIDGVQVERQMAGLTTASPWTPPSSTSADGGMFRTGEIRSNNNITVNGTSQPAWSINLTGGAQFGDARIRGTLVVGPSGADTDAGQSFIASGNYVTNTTGWKMSSAGDLEANSGRIRGRLIVDNEITTAKLALGVMGTNLVADPSFEDTQPVTSPTALTTVASDTGWYRDSVGTSGGAVDLRRLRGRSGAWSVSAYLNGAGGTSSFRSSAIPVVPGQNYKFVFYALTTNATYGLLYELYGGATQSTTTTLQTLDPDFDIAPTLNVNSVPEPYDPVDYTEFTFNYTAPAGINFVRIRLGNSHATATGSIVFDDVSFITKGATAAELSPAGIRLFDDEGLETGAFVSNRPNYFSVSRSGAIVASIDEAGNVAGLSGSFTGDTDNYTNQGDVVGGLIVGGEDYADRMARSPQGVVAQVYKAASVSITNIRSEYGVYEMAFLAYPGRHYRISFSGGTIRANTGAPGMSAIARIRRTLDGSTPSITSTVIRSQWVGFPTNNVDVSIPYFAYQGESTGGSSSPQENRILFTLNALNAGATDWISFSNKAGTSAPAPIECVVEDLGWDVPDGYQSSTGSGTLYTGGTTTEGTTSPPASKKTYTQTWTANSSQTRRGTSSYGNNTVNTSAPSGYNLAGYYSSSNGNQYTYMGFTGTGSLGQTISSAISGATVTKVELYVKNAKFYASSGGNQRFSITTLGSMPSSGVASSTLGVSGAYTPNLTFTPGQGRWLVLNSTAISTIVGGGRVAIIGPGSSNSTSYYSTWYDHVGTGAPQLRITYTK